MYQDLPYSAITLPLSLPEHSADLFLYILNTHSLKFTHQALKLICRSAETLSDIINFQRDSGMSAR